MDREKAKQIQAEVCATAKAMASRIISACVKGFINNSFRRAEGLSFFFHYDMKEARGQAKAFFEI